MNVREAVEKRAAKHGWTRIIGDTDGEIWARGDDRIAIHYTMYGAMNNYLCRLYGKDRYVGVNWGVKAAVHGDELVTGKNKKGQILRMLADKAITAQHSKSP